MKFMMLTWIAVFLLLLVVFIRLSKGARRERQGSVLRYMSGREKLDFDRLYEIHFRQYCSDRAACLFYLKRIAGALELPMGLLRPSDSVQNLIGRCSTYDAGEGIENAVELWELVEIGAQPPKHSEIDTLGSMLKELTRAR